MSTKKSDKSPFAYLYVLHAQHMRARQPNVQNLQQVLDQSLKTHGILVKCQVITSHDPSELSADFIKSVTSTDATDVPAPFNSVIRTVHPRALSNALKHLAALQQVLENSRAHPSAHHIIIEDDAVSNDEVISFLVNTLRGAPAGWDLIFMGLPATKSGTPDKIHYEDVSRVFNFLPSCESYAVTPAAATKLVASFLPLKFPTNIHLSWAMKNLQLNAYICSPNVFLDGSKLGMFVSNIETNNLLSWNPSYNTIRGLLLKDGGPTASDLQTVDELLSKAPFKNHPDFKHLTALAHLAKKEFPQALGEFQEALDVYKAEGALITGPECQFLKDFVQVYRELQTY